MGQGTLETYFQPISNLFTTTHPQSPKPLLPCLHEVHFSYCVLGEKGSRRFLDFLESLHCPVFPV